jgi:CheY-like chemotaxis protein
MLAAALERFGFLVEVAFDGPTGLATAESFMPEIGVLDIGLPGMDGYELARRLRSEPAHAKMRLVAVTGYGQAKDVEEARCAGFDVHLVKPVDLRGLESVLRSSGGMQPP